MRAQTSVVLAGWLLTSAIVGFAAIQYFTSPLSQSTAPQLSQTSYLSHRGSGRLEV